MPSAEGPGTVSRTAVRARWPITSMRRILLALLLGIGTLDFRLQAAGPLTVPLIIQEALYPGSMPGVARTSDPVTVGIPLPDDAVSGAADVGQLGLSGAPVGQFRVLGRWPSGRIKWVLIDTQASLGAGAVLQAITLTTGGGGNFGGPDLAVDNGSTIQVDTGAATFRVRKAYFNGLDEVLVTVRVRRSVRPPARRAAAPASRNTRRRTMRNRPPSSKRTDR